MNAHPPHPPVDTVPGPSPSLRIARTVLGPLPPAWAPLMTRLVYRWSQARRDHHSFVTQAQTGSPFAGVTHDWHAYPFSVHGYSDWRLWAVALAVTAPGGTIIEAGAHVGTETIGYSDIVGAQGRVIAAEPHPVNRARLEHGLRGARNANITILPCAISDRPGRLTFACPPEGPAWTGVGHLVGPQEASSGVVSYHGDPIASETIEVQARTLDSVGEGLDSVSLVAADIEGGELGLLRGGRELLSRCSPAVVLEVSADHLERAGASLAEMREELDRQSYTPFRIRTLGLTSPGSSQSNWLCLPNDRLDLGRRVNAMLRRVGLLPCVGAVNPLHGPRRRPRPEAARRRPSDPA